MVGGPITSTGTIKANLKSETNSSLTAAAVGTTANREYAVHPDANGNLAVNIPWTDTVEFEELTSADVDECFVIE